jgi:hypothetical protein
MQLKRCEYGHFYDPTKYRSCPHCEAYGDDDVGYTVAKEPEREPIERYEPYAPAPAPRNVSDDQVTVGIAQRQMGVDPPVGWLVCVHGSARGTDYHIKAERNTLGRSDRMDISVKGDLGISRESHAVISYNPRARVFTLIPGEGKSIIYLNGQEVLQPLKLTAYDRIEISDTTLVFIPLCTEIFSWDDETNQ